MARRSSPPQYPDDIFEHTRMSFGDHIEVLRRHLIRAIAGLGIVLIVSFVLDSIGASLEIKSLGVGRPMLEVSGAPADEQVRAFYARRNEKAQAKLVNESSDPEKIAAVLARWKDAEFNAGALSSEDLKILRGTPHDMPLFVPATEFDRVMEERYDIKPKQPAKEGEDVKLKVKVLPAHINFLNNRGDTLVGARQFMKTQSTTEAFMVYFKVSLLCCVVLASPWIFYQLWSFVAAGLYPHEKRYVHQFLPFSVGLFILGVVVCQFLVLPGAVKALIAFNNWVELDPDLRLNEWLGFALMLPLVFGVSFQTPLVMFALNRLGLFSAEAYWSKWRYAVFILSCFSAIITPTPDIVTMMYLFVPMFGLYCLGAGICTLFPPKPWDDEDEADAQVAV